MNKNVEVEFKSLISKEEYDRLLKKFKNTKSNIQTNHYFDTNRFSLKASEISFKIREKDDVSLTYKRKKGYSIDEKTIVINKEILSDIKNTGKLDCEKYEILTEIANDVEKVIKDQKLVNIFSLSTDRSYLPYGSGILNIDKSSYLDIVDYEIEFATKSSLTAKDEFIKLINDLQINYKKSDKKIQRAYNRLREIS